MSDMCPSSCVGQIKVDWICLLCFLIISYYIWFKTRRVERSIAIILAPPSRLCTEQCRWMPKWAGCFAANNFSKNQCCNFSDRSFLPWPKDLPLCSFSCIWDLAKRQPSCLACCLWTAGMVMHRGTWLSRRNPWGIALRDLYPQPEEISREVWPPTFDLCQLSSIWVRILQVEAGLQLIAEARMRAGSFFARLCGLGFLEGSLAARALWVDNFTGRKQSGRKWCNTDEKFSQFPFSRISPFPSSIS